MPAYIRPAVDFSTWTRVDRTHTSANLKKRHRDIAYEALMHGGHKLLACVEQQSQPDITMPTRFLAYSADALEPYIKEHKRIPLLINLLFYTGQTAPYPYKDTLQAYYHDPAVGSQELALRFHLIDLTQISDEEILQHGHCAPMELLLKHGRDGNFELEAAAYCDVFQACISVTGDDYLFTILDYAASLSNADAGEKIYHFMEEVLTDKTDIIMNYGRRLRQEGKMEGIMEGKMEGRVEGRAEGRVEGKMEGRVEGIQTVAQSMLMRGYDPNEVKSITGLSQELMYQIIKKG